LLKRVATTIVGLPIVIFAVNFGGWLLLLMCLVMSLTGLRELYKVLSKEDKPIHMAGYIFTIGCYLSIQIFGYGYWLLIGITIFIITVQTCMVIFFQRIPIKDCIVTVYGFLYVPFLFSFILLVRQHQFGIHYVWLVFTSAFGCDTFAYLTGVKLGRNKLTNTPSPKKSVEGLIGGIAGALLVGWLYGFFVSRFSGAEPYAINNIMLNSVIISFFGAIFCIIGDMAASAIKRYAKVKDFGRFFPGHGGVLDRVDGLIFVAPIVYMVMRILLSPSAYV